MNNRSTAHSKRILRNQQSIFVRLFTSFVSASLLIITLTGLFYYEYARQATEKNVNEQVRNSLRESISLFEKGFQTPVESQLKLLESTPSINNFMTVQKEESSLIRFDIEKQFTNLLRSRPELYRSLRFVNAFGLELIHVDQDRRYRKYHSIFSDSSSHKVSPQLRNLFEQFKEGIPGQILFSQPFKNNEGDFIFYAGIAKMEPEIGGIGGAIILEMDLSPFIKMIRSIRTYGQSIIWLLSAQNEVISRPVDSKVNLPFVNGFLDEDDKHIYKHDLYPGQTMSAQAFLSIVMYIPQIIFDKQNKTILKTIFYIALFAIVLTFFVAWQVSRRITAPIIALEQVSHQLAEGDYSTRSNLNDDSEIGKLSKSFNHMADTLEQSIQSLDQQLTSRIAAEQALQESHEYLQLIMNSTGEGIFGIDTNGRCTFCNSSALKLLGYQHEQDLINQNIHSLLQHKDDKGQDFTTEHSLILTSIKSDEFVHSDNEVFWKADNTTIAVEYRSHPVKQDNKIVGAVISFNDITERKEKDKKIIYQAHYDMLTSLPNRFLAMDRLEQMLRNASRQKTIAAVLFIDLDGFKKVNDMLGHEMGDKALIEAAIRLKNALREQDTVGRLGGDEFIVLLSNLKQQLDIRFVAENILEVFRDPFNIDGHELILTASIGIACYPDDSQYAVELLRNADIAMYESKQAGRNTYHFFSEELNTGIQRRLEIEEQLHHALEKDEFVLVYQPIVDIQTMEVSGAEVLIRWQNSKLGQITPDEFIPITEQTGIITKIGQFILNKAIAQTGLWQKSYQKELKISVNVSPRQLHEQSLLDDIHRYLDNYEVAGHCLQLELTEGVLMSQNTAIIQTLALMRNSRIHIAMDDFGTGYSSLSYLRNYPFDSLKIDRTFIRDIHQDRNDKALVNATLSMSHALGVKVVAEGIETVEQLKFLQKAGCEYGQGYYFSKPISAEEFEQQFLNKPLRQHG